MADQLAPWTWRERRKDPRFLAVCAIGFAIGVVLIVTNRDAPAVGVPTAVAAILVCAGLGLTVLPRWADANHSPFSGAVVLFVVAAVILIAGLLAALL